MSLYPKNFQPRVGMAYAINSKTVIRAGYTLNSIRYGAVGGNEGKEGTGVLGFSASPSVATLNGGVTPAFYWQTGFPAYQGAPFFSPSLNTGQYLGPTGATVQAGSMTYGDPILGVQPPHFINWNVSLQREVAAGISLDVAYAASAGHHIIGGAQGYWTDQDQSQIPGPREPAQLLGYAGQRGGCRGHHTGNCAALRQLLRNHHSDAAVVPAVLRP